MSKKIKIIIMFLIFLCVVLIAKSIYAAEEIVIAKGETKEIDFSKDYNTPQSYEVSDSEIIEIEYSNNYDNRGSVVSVSAKVKVTALKEGEATITVTYKGNVGNNTTTEQKIIKVNNSTADTNESNAEVIKNGEEELRQQLKEEWGSDYYEKKIPVIQGPAQAGNENALLIETLNIVVDRIIKLQYNTTNNDNSSNPTIEPNRTQVFEYTVKEDTSWETDDGIIYHRKMTVESTVIADSGNYHENEVYRCKYEFYYLPEMSKIIYTLSRNRIKDTNGEDYESHTGQQNEQAFDERTEGVEEKLKNIVNAIKDLLVDEGEERDSVTFIDILNGEYEPEISEEDNPEEFYTMSSVILTVITYIGMIIAVLILAILGIKYMMGSVEQKAEYKKDLVPYAVGAILLFGISGIIGILQEFGQSFNSLL